MDEYIIINKTQLLKEIKELEGYNDEPELTELKVKKQILSQSIPLIPEIEKAFDAKNKFEIKGSFPFEYTSYKYKNSKDYISNLKLVI